MAVVVLYIIVDRALAFGMVCFAFGLPNLQVGPATFGKIQPGMTEREVEKILGRPSKVVDLSRYSVTKMVRAAQGVRGFRVMKTKSWIGLDRVIEVDFGEKGTVECSSFQHLEEWANYNGFFTLTSFVEILELLIYDLCGMEG